MYRLDTAIQSVTAYCDTTNCKSRNPFKFYFSTAITCPTNARIIMSVQNVSIPNTMYNVTNANNQLSLYDGTNYHDITLPNGIYSAWTFKDYLNVQFLALGVDIACTYSTNSFKYTFYSTLDISIVNTGVHVTTCSALIGVSKDDDNAYIFPITASVPAYTLTLPMTVNFIATPFVFLKIASFNLSNINSFGVINDTLIRIPVNCQYGEVINYRPTELNRFILHRQSINDIEFYITDNHGTTIENIPEIQVMLKFDFINVPQPPQSYDTGTIEYTIKHLPEPPDVGLDEAPEFE